MKALNNIKFITESNNEIERFISEIKNSENYKNAKSIGNMALGHINCMITYLNCMIDKENNDFTEQLDEQIESWTESIYNEMAKKAITSKEDKEVVLKCIKKRNEHEY